MIGDFISDFWHQSLIRGTVFDGGGTLRVGIRSAFECLLTGHQPVCPVESV